MTSTDAHDVTASLITLPGVARLAGVQRPVVSMWRTRTATSDDPFPPVIETRHGLAHFDAEAVAAWLERTGRGNNMNARDDAAAFSAPAGPSSADPTRDAFALTALLALKAITGAELGTLTHAELVELSENADPADLLLSREIKSLTEGGTLLAQHADQMADAAYNEAVAFELVMDDRHRRQLAAHAAAALHPRARRLVAGIAQGLAQTLEADAPVFVDSTHGGGDLLVAVAGLYAEGSPPTFVTCDDDRDVCRLARRRLRVHDLHQEALEFQEVDGAFERSGPAVHVAQFPSPASPDMTDLDVLTAIENIVLQMDDQQRAVIVAPAKLLADRLRAPDCDRIRDDLLRTDRVKAILRLPKGLLVSASRQPMALWALGPADPDVGIADRWTMVGDLSELALLPAAIEDLVGDVIAATERYRLARTHAFKHLRRAATRELHAQAGSLVRSGIPLPARPGVVAELTEALALNDNGQVISPLAVADTSVHDAHKPAPRPLGDLLEQRLVTLHPGNRIKQTSLDVDNGHPVIGPTELVGTSPWGSRTIDRLTFAADHPAGRLTLPGDVIFCTSPEVAARVDAEGGCVVLEPARVLRPARQVVPHVLAADINRVAPRATQWRLWPVRTSPEQQADRLTEMLTVIDSERQAMLRRIASLEQLSELVTNGVTTGTVEIRSHTQLNAVPVHSPAELVPTESRKEGS